MDINYHLLIDIILVSGAVSFILIARKMKNKNPWNLSGVGVVPTIAETARKVFSVHSGGVRCLLRVNAHFPFLITSRVLWLLIYFYSYLLKISMVFTTLKQHQHKHWIDVSLTSNHCLWVHSKSHRKRGNQVVLCSSTWLECLARCNTKVE